MSNLSAEEKRIDRLYRIAKGIYKAIPEKKICPICGKEFDYKPNTTICSDEKCQKARMKAYSKIYKIEHKKENRDYMKKYKARKKYAK